MHICSVVVNKKKKEKKVFQLFTFLFVFELESHGRTFNIDFSNGNSKGTPTTVLINYIVCILSNHIL